MCPTSTEVDDDKVALWWKAFKANEDEDTRNKLLEYYLPLVKAIAERLCSKLPHAVDVDDLVSFGISGLMDAVKSYDIDRGVKFETYSPPRIHGAMLDGLRSMD
ncbi:MAG: FliA/WhiG family RNA polymerase sigma factor, partial [Planctomycetes bacterium]|nr:FliA/WhiG family RNA polymerase sigma factor [Planctomycetota bacterium]